MKKKDIALILVAAVIWGWLIGPPSSDIANMIGVLIKSSRTPQIAFTAILLFGLSLLAFCIYVLLRMQMFIETAKRLYRISLLAIISLTAYLGSLSVISALRSLR